MFSTVRVESLPVRIKLPLTLTSVALTVGAVIRPDTTGFIVGSFVASESTVRSLSGLSASDVLSTLSSPRVVLSIPDLTFNVSKVAVGAEID